MQFRGRCFTVDGLVASLIDLADAETQELLGTNEQELSGIWLTVDNLGGKSRIFSAKDEAIEVAKRKAASEHVGVLVFEGGHVSQVS